MTDADGKKEYRAPALEKGLDVLELLSNGQSYSFPEIVQKLGRSSGELFRMVQVLEGRGYIEQRPGGLTLTPRMFELGLGQPPMQNLVEIALPIMRRLSTSSLQSCHLVMPSRGDMVVVARMESPAQLGFSVRVGYRQPMYMTGSGAILYAFQPDDVRAAWESMFDPAPSANELASFKKRAEALRTAGYVRQPSTIFDGITDISAPVVRGDRAAAALAVPFINPKMTAPQIEEVIALLESAANEISAAVMIGDNRA